MVLRDDCYIFAYCHFHFICWVSHLIFISKKKFVLNFIKKIYLNFSSHCEAEQKRKKKEADQKKKEEEKTKQIDLFESSSMRNSKKEGLLYRARNSRAVRLGGKKEKTAILAKDKGLFFFDSITSKLLLRSRPSQRPHGPATWIDSQTVLESRKIWSARP